MKLRSILRKIWHDIYYAASSDTLLNYAGRCRDMVHQMDIQPQRLPDKVRLQLHLSLCQACSEYQRYSLWLRQQVRQNLKTSPGSPRLNERLQKHFLKKPKAD